MTAYQELEQKMSEAMLELLGPGYIADYYRQAASDFIGLAEWYADRVQQESA